MGKLKDRVAHAILVGPFAVARALARKGYKMPLVGLTILVSLIGSKNNFPNDGDDDK